MARRTAEQALVTRERIVMAAAIAFARHGFSQTSLAHIADEARVTRGAVYAHFEGKRALYHAVCGLIDWPLLDSPGRPSGTVENDPIGMLRRMVRAWMKDIEANPVRRCVLDILLHKTEWTAENAELLQRLHRSNDKAAQRIGHLIEGATAMGLLSLPVSAQVASTTLQAALLGVVSTCLCSATVASLPCRSDWLLASLLAPSEGRSGLARSGRKAGKQAVMPKAKV